MWYYLEDQVTRGPAPHEEMLALFREERLPETTLVWREGMSDWVPAGQAGLLPPKAPPPLPEEVLQQTRPVAATVATSASVTSQQEVSGIAWRRMLARQLDLIFFGMVCIAILPAISLDLANWVAESGGLYFSVALAIAFIPLEAWMLSASGATPGKRLFSLRVVHSDGSMLQYRTALFRSWRVSLLGIALGIPIASLITRGIWYQRFLESRSTAWDQSCQSEVRASPMTQGRRLAASVLFGIYIAMVFVGVSQALS